MEVDFAKAMPPKLDFVIVQPVQLIVSGDLTVNGRRARSHAEEEINPARDG